MACDDEMTGWAPRDVMVWANPFSVRLANRNESGSMRWCSQSCHCYQCLAHYDLVERDGPGTAFATSVSQLDPVQSAALSRISTALSQC